MRACVFLGINFGFGPTDRFALPRIWIDFDDAPIHWVRVKNEQDRMCPETLESVLKHRTKRNGHK